jgi:hypothetical protein
MFFPRRRRGPSSHAKVRSVAYRFIPSQLISVRIGQTLDAYSEPFQVSRAFKDPVVSPIVLYTGVL